MLIVEGLNILAFSYRNPLIEKDYPVFLSKSHIWIKYLRVDLELHYFAKLSNLKIVTHMKAKKELPNQTLLINHLAIDAFNYHAKQCWMFEPEIFIFNFALGFMVSR